MKLQEHEKGLLLGIAVGTVLGVAVAMFTFSQGEDAERERWAYRVNDVECLMVSTPHDNLLLVAGDARDQQDGKLVRSYPRDPGVRPVDHTLHRGSKENP